METEMLLNETSACCPGYSDIEVESVINKLRLIDGIVDITVCKCTKVIKQSHDKIVVTFASSDAAKNLELQVKKIIWGQKLLYLF
ncbi:hypothetical protein [Bacteroides sp. 519]|uniref:hypothetical protein n=1 Tax=Bacteroides sp. 519 TaxID=2302937 RepID=UPI0013D43D69|nr:hypothetical protein [Bacteroides sp. 519]NDV57859.1 hypothetical protein [Bacteroides sp. 519]